MILIESQRTDVAKSSDHQSDFRLSRRGNEFRELMYGLTTLDFKQKGSPLQKVCEAGSEYGLRVLEKSVSRELFCLLRPKAKRRIADELRRILARATRPCFALELNAFRRAFQAIYLHQFSSTPELIEKKFLGERSYERLISLFKKFPVLGELWCQLIHQWCESVCELLERIDADKQTLSRGFFYREPLGGIADIRAGLSDPHNKGRTVMRVQFDAGSIIYKPRCGDGEEQWFRLIAYLNATSFRPKLTAARMLRRHGYCWMQQVEFKECKDERAARRFYKRLGGMIAVAYLVNAVDCHRDNMIASGEYPVLVDAETLWHVIAVKKKYSVLDRLNNTGFLPTSNRRANYQYRSSTLGRTTPGQHTPHIAGQPLTASCFENDIVDGFCRAWCCLLGTRTRHAAFTRHLASLQSQEWRRIYCSTRVYDAIMRASIQPAALRSRTDRDGLIAHLCDRSGVSEIIMREEIEALRRLDIPYFSRRPTAGSPLPESNVAPAGIIKALRHAVRA
jgi:lantibiotic modifying enzyme